MRNDCQYVCLWEDRDLRPDLSVQDLLRACAQRQQEEAAAALLSRSQAQQLEAAAAAAAAAAWGGGAPPSFYERTVADMTAFFDQLAVGRALEPVRVSCMCVCGGGGGVGGNGWMRWPD